LAGTASPTSGIEGEVDVDVSGIPMVSERERMVDDEAKECRRGAPQPVRQRALLANTAPDIVSSEVSGNMPELSAAMSNFGNARNYAAQATSVRCRSHW
jgi:hypothetical protein